MLGSRPRRGGESSGGGTGRALGHGGRYENSSAPVYNGLPRGSDVGALPAELGIGWGEIRGDTDGVAVIRREEPPALERAIDAFTANSRANPISGSGRPTMIV
jgi:hypothetical protein